MRIEGACHCRNITFTLDWEPDPERIPARACGCSFCRKHGGVWTSNPNARLSVSVKDPVQVSHYAFGTATAEFHVCVACGVVPVVTSQIDGRLYAVVSVHAFENVSPSMIDRAPTDFDGEDLDGRLARRAKNWISNVSFPRV